MTQDEFINIINQIISFLIEYFSIRQNRIFWILILFFAIIVENGIRIWKRKNHIKLWLKEHNIGKKYRW